MPPHQLGSLRSEPLNAEIISLELRRIDAARRNAADDGADASEALARAEADQLARDIADIEYATLALRKAEPALQSWIKSPAILPSKQHSVWLLIAVIWISSALITTSAVVAIATLAG